MKPLFGFHPSFSKASQIPPAWIKLSFMIFIDKLMHISMNHAANNWLMAAFLTCQLSKAAWLYRRGWPQASAPHWRTPVPSWPPPPASCRTSVAPRWSRIRNRLQHSGCWCRVGQSSELKTIVMISQTFSAEYY